MKERSDRVLLAPWVKFLWESYRNMMELLKNNNTIEKVYADVAKDGEGGWGLAVLYCNALCCTLLLTLGVHVQRGLL